MISIVIPVYNTQQYLRECIESVIAQTYNDIEILLIDDGSTDKSPEICDEYTKDSRVKVYHRENAGLSASRQFGFDQAVGEYIMTIDADDYITNNFVEILYNNIIQHNVDIACCCRYDFLGKEKHVVPLIESNTNPLITNQQYITNNLERLNSYVWLSDSWNKLYRTSFVRRTGVRFELPKKFNGNDFAFNYKLVLHCPSFCFVNKPLLYHRLTPNSIVRRKNKPLQEGFEIVLSQIIEESRQCNYSVGIYDRFSYIYSNMLQMVALDIAKDSSNFLEIRKRVSRMFNMSDVFKHDNQKIRNIIINSNIVSVVITFFVKVKAQLLLSLFLQLYNKLKK